MKHSSCFSRVSFVLFACLLFIARFGWATSGNFSSVPPLLSVGGTPKVMLVVGKDHQLFQKAYTDYSDTTGDGIIDVGYDDTFEYAGYFDPEGCYNYTSSEYRIVAVGDGPNGHYCNSPPAASTLWSGNFLNWATMTRVDILRQVLYGGKRSTDNIGRTVLERAELPPDVHSFVKVYNSSVSGIGTDYYTPFNVQAISLCNLTQTSGGVPRIRVANGNWRRWSSSEVIQCQFDNGSSSPESAKHLDSFTVRVEVCSGIDSNRPRCRPYGANSKPSGLLQRYGENGQIHFGLLSGSDHKNIRGGVVRRNIQRLVGNNNINEDEINLSTGQFTSTLGIIRTIDAFRIQGYSYSERLYSDCSTFSISISTFKTSGSSDRQCRDWGNPTGEQLLESYLYFAGGSRTGAFYTNKDSGLPAPSWSDPLTPETACSECISIVLSAGLNSFDWDNLGSASGLPGLSGASSVNSKTNQVGDLEAGGNFSGNFLFGGTGNSRHCTGKSASDLSDILGLCPEQPALEGAYSAAGLAFHARTQDMRTQSGFDGNQTITSYGIRIAESVPSFVIPVGSGSITFVPACESAPGNSYLSCSLFDVDVLSLSYSEGQLISGEMRFAWEDSPWGNDYDLDGMSQISFCVGSSCSPSIGSNQIRFQVQVPYSAARNNLRFSYTIAGTQGDDGLASWLNRPGGQDNNKIDGNSGPNFVQPPTTYTAGSSSAEILKGPLWYVGKYGGFDDLDGDGTPNNVSGDSREWDSEINETGELGSDGIPDNYFELRNPAQLETQLAKILGEVAAQRASGTDVALTSVNKTGVGATYQANYEPRRQQHSRVVTWIGDVFGLFIDGKGHFREDANSNGVLDDYGTDPIVQLEGENVQRYSTSDNGNTIASSGSPVPLYEAGLLWSGRDQLAELSNSQVINQRAFNNSAATGRYVITWLDTNQDFQVTQNEVVPFTASQFNGQQAWLDVSSSSQAANVVNYVRGEDGQPNTRSRLMDYDNDGTEEVIRVADIINASPVVMGIPSSGYDSRYGDDSYQAFKQHYAQRRNVVFTADNSGQIRAFNAGFPSADGTRFDLSANGETQHPLGSEIWTYVPLNILPHLQWLREPNYTHNYFVDGEPLLFDANVFAADADHPYGWGTLLLIGMGFGGSLVQVSDLGERAFASAYVLLDVTNPEVPPTVLAEIRNPLMGYTTSRPALVKARRPGTDDDWFDPSRNEWKLLFGSGPGITGGFPGPAAYTQVTSQSEASVMTWDIGALGTAGTIVSNTQIPNAFMGNLTAVDWDQNFIDDYVYGGVVETVFDSLGNATEFQGRLLRVTLGGSTSAYGNATFSTFLDPGKPFVAAPIPLVDDFNRRWIYGGTGRLLSLEDRTSTQSQSFYGVKEPVDDNGAQTDAAVAVNTLIDTTNIEVFTDDGESLKNVVGSAVSDVVIDGNTIPNFDSLKVAMRNQPGWAIGLTHDGSLPSGRNLSEANSTASLVLFSEFNPPPHSCAQDGASTLYAVDFQTGTAPPGAPIGSSNTITHNSANVARKKISLGAGLVQTPQLHKGGDGQVRTITQTSTGTASSGSLEISYPKGGSAGWKQIHDLPPAIEAF